MRRSTAGCLLATTLWLAPVGSAAEEVEPDPTPLERLRTLLQHGDYGQAARAAIRLEQSAPHDPEVAAIVGICLFRAGQPDQAALRFERALETGARRRPAAWRARVRFSLASALFAAGEYAQAEEQFVAVTGGSSALAVLAAVNAAYAALERGDLDRAQAHYQRGLALPGATRVAPELKSLRHDLVADSPHQTRAGRARTSPSSRVRPIARPSKSGLVVTALSELGWDSNAVQSGLGGGDLLALPTVSVEGGAFGHAFVWLDYGARVNEAIYANLSYGLRQLAYLDADLDDISEQDHEVGAELIGTIRDHWFLRARGFLRFSFVGLRSFGGFVGTGGGSAELWYDRRSHATRIGLQLSSTTELSEEFSYLRGWRLDLSASEHLTGGGFALGVEARLRRERVGAFLQTVAPEFYPRCDLRCIGATQSIPLSYWAPSLSVDLTSPSWGPISLRGELAAEVRVYSETADVFAIDGSVIDGSPTDRSDLLLRSALEGTWRFSKQWSVFARVELLRSWSTIDNTDTGPGHGWDYDNRNFAQWRTSIGAIATLDP